MYTNIGAKIKGLAKFVCFLGIAAALVAGIGLMTTQSIGYREISPGVYSQGGSVPAGLLVMVLGSIGSWLGSLVLYGFGQLIENSDLIRDRLGAAGEAEAPAQDKLPENHAQDK